MFVMHVDGDFWDLKIIYFQRTQKYTKMKVLHIFFNVGLLLEDIFSGHLLSPVFQSSYTLQLHIS